MFFSGAGSSGGTGGGFGSGFGGARSGGFSSFGGDDDIFKMFMGNSSGG